MKFVSNLPDNQHVPYKFLAAEPHFKTVVQYFRPSDYWTIAGVTVGFPAAHVLWERMTPSFHPKHLPRLMLIQVPFFATVGFIYACQNSYFRFWGWKENSIEAARWEADADKREARNAGKPQGWMDGQDW